MGDKIELTPEVVREECRVMMSEVENVQRLGKRAGSSTQKHSLGRFGENLDENLKKQAEKLRELGDTGQQSATEYTQRLDTTVNVFEQTEQSQLDTLSAIREALAETSIVQA